MFIKELETEIRISATAKTIWQKLTMIDTRTRTGFERMNTALKRVCEAG